MTVAWGMDLEPVIGDESHRKCVVFSGIGNTDAIAHSWIQVVIRED